MHKSTLICEADITVATFVGVANTPVGVSGFIGTLVNGKLDGVICAASTMVDLIVGVIGWFGALVISARVPTHAAASIASTKTHAATNLRWNLKHTSSGLAGRLANWALLAHWKHYSLIKDVPPE